MVLEWLEKNAQDENEEKITQQMDWFSDATVINSLSRVSLKVP